MVELDGRAGLRLDGLCAERSLLDGRPASLGCCMVTVLDGRLLDDCLSRRMKSTNGVVE